MTFLSILPVEVRGISGQTTTSSGSWNLANFARQCSSMRCLRPSLDAPGSSTTVATGRSSHRGCGIATTAAMTTPLIDAMWFSRSMEEIHSPPDLMTSLDLSLMTMAPSSSILATSPVTSQPLWNLSGAGHWKYSWMTQGPRTRSSPARPCGMSLSRFPGSATRASTPGSRRPARLVLLRSSSGPLERSLCLATLLPRHPRGFVSVMPQPWTNSTLSSSPNQAIISGGGAEPPHVSVRSFRAPATLATPRFSMAWRTPRQTVGTPRLKWTPQSSMQSRRLSASMKRPLKTVRVPSIMRTNGTPQLSTWNMGTKGSTTSEPLMPSWSAPHDARVCRYVERWL
mmetsp:Transcript_97657/g.291664  ORF Transcript_97657/g.291664 Transcript_97657/m.291664 type:complete len:341 (+) Transcript_97657:97-1119(+)